MLRRWAVLALLVAAYAPAARAEPLDLDLSRLGAPSASVWGRISELCAEDLECAAQPGGVLTAEQQRQLAIDARRRFAMLSTELGLALSSALLQPGSTTGHSGFDVQLEGAVAPVHADVVGQGTAFYPARDAWPTRGQTPDQLFLPSFHVRKALPFSFELGGRVIYLSQSSYWGGQLEGKWALNEGFWWLPDLAVRVAHTTLFGHKDWNLDVTDFDLLASRKFAVNGVLGLTPYLSARFAYLRSGTDPIDFAPNYVRPGETPPNAPQDVYQTKAKFTTLQKALYRTTLGVRMTAYAVSLAAEVTYFAGGSGGEGDGGATEYPTYDVESSTSAAFRLGFEF